MIVVRIGEADLAEPFHQRLSIVEPASGNHNVVSKHLSNYPLRKTSRYFHSCIFHPCNFDRATFSTPTFSPSPIALRHSLYAAREKHRQNYLLFYFLVLFNRPTFPTGHACPCRSSKDERLEILDSGASFENCRTGGKWENKRVQFLSFLETFSYLFQVVCELCSSRYLGYYVSTPIGRRF